MITSVYQPLMGKLAWRRHVLAGCLMLAAPAAPGWAHDLPRNEPPAVSEAPSWQPRPGQAVERLDSGQARIWLWKTAGSRANTPWIVALHGCGGMWTRNGSLDSRSSAFIKEFQGLGYNLAFIDSFSGRQTREICTQPVAQRSIRVSARRADVLQAVATLTQSAAIQRYVLLGWSNGATTALDVLDRARWPQGIPAPSQAFLLYPGCEGASKSVRALVAPTQFFLGGADNWTPPGPCVELVKTLHDQQPGNAQAHVYPNAVHGFDAPTGEVRPRTDVPRKPGQAPVMVGPDPPSRAHAYGNIAATLEALSR